MRAFIERRNWLGINGGLWVGAEAEFIRRQMPYGKWTYADGREVLFDRNYVPIFERMPSGPVSKAAPNKLPGIKKGMWLYKETGGVTESAKRKAAESVLQEWGVFEICMADIE